MRQTIIEKKQLIETKNKPVKF